MTVLAASVLLTYLFDEPGAEQAAQHLAGGIIHTVNFAEVLTKLAEKGVDPAEARAQMEAAGILPIIQIDAGDPSDADHVATLRPLTRSQGLSLGDRYCLALGKRLGLPVATMDRAWGELDIDVEVLLLH